MNIARDDAPLAAPHDQLELELLLQAIYSAYHYDFRQYSSGSIARCVAQAQFRLGCSTISRLQERILHEPHTFGLLLQYLTVQVSDMFRDPGYWRALREQVVPRLRDFPVIKVWVAGCSCGEEAYSLAILLREHGLLERTQIYATDINTESLECAAAGVYALDRIARFSQNHRESGAPLSLSEYYTAGYGAATFDRSLRSRIVFSDHSLASDGVFSEVNLVSCRNVLIYFNPELQRRVFGLFARALSSGGFLGLGAKESTRNCEERSLFRELVAGERIYQRA
jgi:chemotaxis protein methyltransferase CheR